MVWLHFSGLAVVKCGWEEWYERDQVSYEQDCDFFERDQQTYEPQLFGWLFIQQKFFYKYN
ncbi:hypothetical protein [Bacillus suaedae]|uniref:Uncharacterized protein n=1 Tax=Halalkalibacter suaedae TaxID=2822140 RepID=A0A941AM48_9BACI|nr:hypothetical protein [Bacillus suaedae]MBP3950095.1 hypothetical protein [Bacillus suaedae]